MFGKVVNEGGRPLEGVLVGVEGYRSIGTSTDRGGRFEIRGVPPGRKVVRTISMDYTIDAAFLELDAGDRERITLRLEEIRIPCPGCETYLPPMPRRVDAESLLPTFLEDPSVDSLLIEAWPGLQEGDTVLALAPWMPDTDALHTAHVIPKKVLKDCPECVTQKSFTIEGAPAYLSGIRHLSIGLREGGAGTPQVTFCAAPVNEGDFLEINCGGAGHGFLEIRYFMRGPGDWVQLRRRPPRR